MSTAKSCLSILNCLTSANCWQCDFHFEKLASDGEAKSRPLFKANVTLSGDNVKDGLVFTSTASSMNKAKKGAARQMLEYLLFDKSNQCIENILYQQFFCMEFLSHLNNAAIKYKALESVRHEYTGSKCSCKSHCCVQMQLFDQEFTGEGHNRWYARNDAASQAFKAFGQDMKLILNVISNEDVDTASNNFVSLVYEKASQLKLNVSIIYNDELPEGSESLDNSNNFKCKLTIGEHVTHGEGRTKKQAKIIAAKDMVNLLSNEEDKMNSEKTKRKHRKTNGDRTIDDKLPAVTYLYQLLQKRGEDPPLFVDHGLIDESTTSGKVYKCEVSIPNYNAIGTGKSKKEAKANSAEELLQALCIRNKNPVQEN